ncbi:DUF924 domain-containing protein [Myxococcota bacterium]|nr:DUF924 domain-containing protein [Myxococcota bacterium]
MPVSPAFVPSILEFWFGSSDPGAQVAARMHLWFTPDEATDQLIRERYGPLHAAACRGEAENLCATPGGRLAYILLIDQFSRNLFRGSPRAFAHDRRSLHAALEGIDQGQDLAFGLHQRAFVYLPLEHAEDRHLQQRSVELFTRLKADASPDQAAAAQTYLDHAIAHRKVIDEFGRFPHRNQILGRTTTIEEFAYLRKPGAGFGGY